MCVYDDAHMPDIPMPSLQPIIDEEYEEKAYFKRAEHPKFKKVYTRRQALRISEDKPLVAYILISVHILLIRGILVS